MKIPSLKSFQDDRKQYDAVGEEDSIVSNAKIVQWDFQKHISDLAAQVPLICIESQWILCFEKSHPQCAIGISLLVSSLKLLLHHNLYQSSTDPIQHPVKSTGRLVDFRGVGSGPVCVLLLNFFILHFNPCIVLYKTEHRVAYPDQLYVEL